VELFLAWTVIGCFVAWVACAFIYGASTPWLPEGYGFAPMNPMKAIVLTPVFGLINAIGCAIMVLPTWLLLALAVRIIQEAG
jgi:hypothetical protein